MDRPSASGPALDGLDSLIAVHEELAKQADTRRQRGDAAGATLMTTAVALGAAIVAAANALSDTQPVSGLAPYIALVSLVATLAFGAASRASILQKLNRSDETSVVRLWKQEQASIHELRAMADRVGTDDADLDTRAIKKEVCRLWRVRVEIGERNLAFKNRLLVYSGACLAVALAALVFIGFSILGDS